MADRADPWLCDGRLEAESDMLRADAMRNWTPPLLPLRPGAPAPGTAFREGDVATTHFFLSKRVGNNANARQFLPCQGKGNGLTQTQSTAATCAFAPRATGASDA